MKLVLAPDKFKGSLRATDVCAAMATGARRANPSIEIDECPMADGGEGTVDALVRAAGGRLITRCVTGPLPEMQVDATFGILDDGATAVIEMASASGLHLLRPDQYDPMRATTRGTGELIRAVVQMGIRRIILGLGGSATVDGGVGCAEVCKGLARDSVEIICACDVKNPLYGLDGAAHIFGPQKGATPEHVEQLDARLRKLTEELDAEHLAYAPGAGAAGGMGFGMMAFFGATLRSGVEIVIEATKLRDRLQGTDLCITGEGRLDDQTASGKVAAGVARACNDLGVPCCAVVGSADDRAAACRQLGLRACCCLVEPRVTIERAMRDAPQLIAAAAAELVAQFAKVQ